MLSGVCESGADEAVQDSSLSGMMHLQMQASEDRAQRPCERLPDIFEVGDFCDEAELDKGELQFLQVRGEVVVER